METLIFQVEAPLSSWGETAVGEYRPTADYPGQSAIEGLLAAALGICRENHAAQIALRNSYRMAVGVLSQGRLLRDYHTTQVPSRADMKKRPHATRRDELALPKDNLNTILSSRDYRQGAAAMIALLVMPEATYSLMQLAEALKKPHFVLYLGRKSCPIAVPLYPRIVEAKSITDAFSLYQKQLLKRWEDVLPKMSPPSQRPLQKVAWGDDFGDEALALIGIECDMSVLRKDRVITRRGWQFADRYEHIALLVEKEK